MKKLLFLSIFLSSLSSHECSCIYSEFGIKDYQNASFIVEGKILKIKTDEQTLEKVMTFKVRETIKGKVDKIIEIRTPQNSAACGLNVKENDSWLFFVHEYNNKKGVGLCGKNVRHSRRKGESKELQKKNCKMVEEMIQKMQEFKKSENRE